MRAVRQVAEATLSDAEPLMKGNSTNMVKQERRTIDILLMALKATMNWVCKWKLPTTSPQALSCWCTGRKAGCPVPSGLISRQMATGKHCTLPDLRASSLCKSSLRIFSVSLQFYWMFPENALGARDCTLMFSELMGWLILEIYLCIDRIYIYIYTYTPLGRKLLHDKTVSIFVM